MNTLSEINKLNKKIISCKKCPRLIKHCLDISKKKKRAFIDETYWGKPVPSFGDVPPKVFILGLAPAAHGANRTGRMFTGDQSGLWLYRALYENKLSTKENSEHKNDNLRLKKCYISAAVHCAPPDNKPTTVEINNCKEYLEKELEIFNSIQVYLALGRLAYDQIWKNLNQKQKKQKFSHGKIITLDNHKKLVLSFHPSQQNTFTKRLTKEMFDDVFNFISKEIK